MDDQPKTLKMFAALTRKAKANEAWITRVIEAEDKDSAAEWFGENGF